MANTASVEISSVRRSMRLVDMAPLASVRGCSFVSLQLGPPAAQLNEPPAGLVVLGVAQRLHDFADTAALMANLDLVIAVDTAVVHLAGAMGKKVWVLLPYITDWRWMLDRDDSPWYPTMRLFRQKTPGDWTSVINRVVRKITEEIR